MTGQERVVFLKPLVGAPTIEVGDYTYYDHPERALGLRARRRALRVRSRAAGDRPVLRDRGRHAFLMGGANHADQGPSTFPFGVFGPPWAGTMDLVMGAPSRGDTTVGHDVWLGYQALVLPGVTIGHGAVVAAASVVSADVPPYAIVAGNPARVVGERYDEADVQRLLRAAWWDWPIEAVTQHARAIMSGTPAELERIAAGLAPR